VDRDWKDPPRRPLVVVIGDSFVQAAQVDLEAGFGRQLERRFHAAGFPGAEVRSLGVPGAGTATALGVLRQYALPLKPDLVVLGFLVANDVLNNHPLLEGKDDKPFYALREGVLVPVDAPTALASGGWAWRHSHAWRAVARTLATRRVAARKLALGKGIPLDLRVHDPAPDPVWDEAWAVTDALVAAMARESAAGGARFGTLLFPDGPMSNDRDHARLVATWPAASAWDLTRAQARAERLTRAHGPTCDLLPPLRGDPSYYLAEDGHWTAAGHARAAEAAADCVAAWLAPD
jgi:lysophospholipase L1-like esterase